MGARLESNYLSLGAYSVQDTDLSTESSSQPWEVGLSVIVISQVTDGLGGHLMPRQKSNDSKTWALNEHVVLPLDCLPHR